MYHRGGHSLLDNNIAQVWPFWKLHLRHHDARARPEWLAYGFNYVPLELMGCVVYATIVSVDPVALGLTCLLLSVGVHLGIHTLCHVQFPVDHTTTKNFLRRMHHYHRQHHKGTHAAHSFSVGSLLGDMLFGTVPPFVRWY
jgi:sterol desaturase/sphingolipid hydroxylase (fatty acid hydroxylase superfamily)